MGPLYDTVAHIPTPLRTEADGVVVRDPDPDSRLGSHSLAATNHFRRKAQPTACRRYTSLQRQLSRSETWTEDSLWRLGTSVRLPEVVHTALLLPRERRLRIWLRGDDAIPFEWSFDRSLPPP